MVLDLIPARRQPSDVFLERGDPGAARGEVGLQRFDLGRRAAGGAYELGSPFGRVFERITLGYDSRRATEHDGFDEHG